MNVSVDGEPDADIGEVGRKPGAQTTLSPRAVGRRAWSVRLVASVNATTGDCVSHVHGSGDVIVDGFPSSEQGDHRFEPAQVTRPTHVISIVAPGEARQSESFSDNTGWEVSVYRQALAFRGSCRRRSLGRCILLDR